MSFRRINLYCVWQYNPRTDVPLDLATVCVGIDTQRLLEQGVFLVKFQQDALSLNVL